MARTKKGPALFELMRGEGGETSPPPQGRPQTPRSPAEPVQDERQGESAPTSPEILPPQPPLSAEPFCEVIGGRVRLSLTQGSATIVVAVAAVLLAAAVYVGYWLGERRGKEIGRLAVQGHVLDEIEQARRAAPARNLFEGIGSDPTAPISGSGDTPPPRPAAAVNDTSEPDTVAWVRGNNYVVVQDFKRDAHGDAVRARKFLEEHGVQTVILELERAEPYRYRLLTVTGFNLDDPAQRKLADEYRAKVRRLGRAYFAGGGRHDFATAYFRKLTADHW